MAWQCPKPRSKSRVNPVEPISWIAEGLPKCASKSFELFPERGNVVHHPMLEKAPKMAAVRIGMPPNEDRHSYHNMPQLRRRTSPIHTVVWIQTIQFQHQPKKCLERTIILHPTVSYLREMPLPLQFGYAMQSMI
jgi:hypothetical protein